jgi:hypothetical protein
VSRAPTCQDGIPPPTQSPETENLKMQSSSRMGAVNQVFTGSHNTCVADGTDILTKSGCELDCTMMDLNDRFWRDQCLTTGPGNHRLGLVLHIILASGCPGHPQGHTVTPTETPTGIALSWMPTTDDSYCGFCVWLVGLGLAVFRVRQGWVWLCWDQVRFGLVMFGCIWD